MSTNPEGRLTIALPNLAPRELLNIHMADTGNLPEVLTVRSAAGPGKPVSAQPVIQYPKWVNLILLALLGIGALAVSWSAIYAILFLLRRLGFI
jgi:hypothetical protein